MKTFIKLLFLAFSSAVIFNQFFITNVTAQIEGIDNLNSMEKQANSLKSLRSTIKLIKSDSYLNEINLYEGRLLYLRTRQGKTSIRVEWIKPVPESFSVTNGKYAFSPQPRLQSHIVGKFDAAEKGHHIDQMLAFLNMSVKRLKASYMVKFLGLENIDEFTAGVHLELTPKSAGRVKTIDLWVDKSGLPIQIRFIENNLNLTTILLSEIKRNLSSTNGS